MSENELGDTQQNPTQKHSPEESEQTQTAQVADTQEMKSAPVSDTQETQGTPSPEKPKKRKGGRFKLILGIIIGLLLFITLGALGGLQAGITDRENQEQLDRAVEAVYQFELAQDDLKNGQCDIARQRFEYVIQLNPTFPGAADKLAEAMLCVGTSGEDQPVAEVTLAPTPTLDGRSVEEIYAQAQAYFEAQNWNELLPLLDTVRSINSDFQALEVDRMYYVALRNRGVTRILVEADLEGGIFDLNQAERIGPLDTDATNYRDWAILYIIGQSFWDVDWGQAVQYFSQIAAVVPNLSDSSFYTAQNRLLDAQAAYATDLIDDAHFQAGKKQWCQAESMLNEANSYSPLSPEVQVTATWYTEKCALNGDE